MKVLLINGSARKNGNTFSALTEVATQLSKHNIDSEIMQIGNRPIRSCIDCSTCKIKGNNKCAFDDDLCNVVIEKLKESDAIVVGSPVYYGQPNGAILSLMQRVFFASNYSENKPAAAVVVCRRAGATSALQTLNMMFQLKNMPIVTSQYWNIVYGMREGEARLDIEGMQTMRTLADNMSWILKKIHANNNPNHPQREVWQGMNFIR